MIALDFACCKCGRFPPRWLDYGYHPDRVSGRDHNRIVIANDGALRASDADGRAIVHLSGIHLGFSYVIDLKKVNGRVSFKWLEMRFPGKIFEVGVRFGGTGASGWSGKSNRAT